MIATHVPATGNGGGMVRYAVELAAAMRSHPGVDLSVLVQRSARRFFDNLLGDPRRVFATGLPVVNRSAVERTGLGVDVFSRGRTAVVRSPRPTGSGVSMRCPCLDWPVGPLRWSWAIRRPARTLPSS
jgi:hypothetical protein